MAQYKVLQRFRLYDDPALKGTGPVKEAGEIIEISVKRADQAIKTLGDSYLERIDNKENDKEEAD